VLAIGTELAEADSFIYDLPINGKVIRIDIDPARFNDCFPATVGVQGDTGAAVDILLAELNDRGISGSGRDTANDLEQVRARQCADFTPVEKQHIKVLNLMRDILPDDAIMMGDIAQLVYTGTQAMPVYRPRTWLYPAGYGTLGCALPGAIGVKIALPERDVVALVGDGGFMFTVQELATAVEEELTIPIILWNNNSYAMIRDGMRKRGYPEIGVNPRNPDFVKLADAYGCPGILVESAAVFETALRDAMGYKGPTIIMVMEDDSWLI
jgi:5-guanidino-2-oxopentanoate decarboxylase